MGSPLQPGRSPYRMRKGATPSVSARPGASGLTRNQERAEMKRQWRHKKAPHAQGFTLIEVLIAMLMFAIPALGLAKLQVGQIQAEAKAKRRTVALTFAQDTIEQVCDGQGCANSSQTQGAITYTLQCDTSNGPDGTQNISVTVSWADPTSQSV